MAWPHASGGPHCTVRGGVQYVVGLQYVVGISAGCPLQYVDGLQFVVGLQYVVEKLLNEWEQVSGEEEIERGR
eukprot:5028491-Lingulodinium_polyedra.AAC.1